MKKRIISAIVVLLIVIPLLILGGYPFIFGCSIIAILGFKEIIDLAKSHDKIPNMMILIGLIDLIILVLNNLRDYTITYGLSYQRILLVILSLIIPVVFLKDYKTKDAFYLVGSVLLLGLFFNLLIVLRYRNLYLLVYLILIPILTDTFALFGGKMFGKHKMAPKISPNKTWEGAIIGLSVASLLGCVFYILLVESFSFKVIIMTVLLSGVGQIGDLIMSKIKRENDLKDFSNLMPGHGGVLDRLDSLIFVVLTYVALMFL